jgi:hypothetical protein
MERPFIVENARDRERLRNLVARTTDEELSLPLGEGWTIAAALAHLAFWDLTQKNGAEDEIRTRDLLLGKEAFYH